MSALIVSILLALLVVLIIVGGLFLLRGVRDAAGRATADVVDIEKLSLLAAGNTAAASATQAAVSEDYARSIREAAEHEASTIRSQAREAADLVEREARARAATVEAEAAERARDAARAARTEMEADLRVAKAEVDSREERMALREERMTEREERLDAETTRVEARDREIERIEATIRERESGLAEAETRIAMARTQTLERIAGLTSAEAKAELLTLIEAQAKRDAAVTVREIEAQAREDGEGKARQHIITAIQRLASTQTAESVVSVLALPGDEFKGRIIGREGRNIRTFESVTGVNVIIDDTPEAVLLSCFDPVRREVGRLTLEALVLDGRIHPHRIEEQYEKSKIDVEKLCVRAGEDAVFEFGIGDMHEDLIALLGQLRYRTSYGQNVLGHLIECGHLAQIMAAELKLPKEHIVRGSLLHDLGKALTHEVQGSHALIGAELARKYGEHEEVIHAIEAHHNEVEPRSIAAVLTQACDAISGGRPGARRESLESYVQRLERIEEIAGSREGVEKVYAMQAGREIRVMVMPDKVDDIGAQVIARDIAKQIEEELTYPGQIRVTVVRESRTSELAK